MKDNNRPWFKFWARDYLSDEKVRALSFQARGVYIEILCLMWKSRICKLPNDLKRIARMVGLPQDDFKKIWDELMHPDAQVFSIHRNKIQSNRLLAEKADLERIRRARSEAAKRRWHKDLNANASRLHIQNGMQNDGISDPDPDAEADDLDRSAGADFSGNGSKHYSKVVGEYLEVINDNCLTLCELSKSNGKDFNPWQAVQMAVNNNAHFEAIIKVQKGMIKQWQFILKPMGYWQKSIECNSKNFHERDHIKQAEKFKQAWNVDPRIKKLIQGIGSK